MYLFSLYICILCFDLFWNCIYNFANLCSLTLISNSVLNSHYFPLYILDCLSWDWLFCYMEQTYLILTVPASIGFTLYADYFGIILKLKFESWISVQTLDFPSQIPMAAPSVNRNLEADESFNTFFIWFLLPDHRRYTDVFLHMTTHTVGFLWTRDRPVAETSLWRHTKFTRDRHPCPRRYSNPRSESQNSSRTTPLTRVATLVS